MNTTTKTIILILLGALVLFTGLMLYILLGLLFISQTQRVADIIELIPFAYTFLNWIFVFGIKIRQVSTSVRFIDFSIKKETLYLSKKFLVLISFEVLYLFLRIIFNLGAGNILLNILIAIIYVILNFATFIVFKLLVREKNASLKQIFD